MILTDVDGNYKYSDKNTHSTSDIKMFEKFGEEFADYICIYQNYRNIKSCQSRSRFSLSGRVEFSFSLNFPRTGNIFELASVFFFPDSFFVAMQHATLGKTPVPAIRSADPMRRRHARRSSRRKTIHPSDERADIRHTADFLSLSLAVPLEAQHSPRSFPVALLPPSSLCGARSI